MDDNNEKNIKQLTNKNYIQQVESVMLRLISQDDQRKAKDLALTLEKAILKNSKELSQVPNIYEFYIKQITMGKYIALPLLSNKEVVSLLSQRFNWQFYIESYNILDKLKYKLINILVYEDRDKFKEELKRALLNSEEIITPELEYKKVKDWIKDYNVKVGTGIVDRLKLTQYLTDLKRVKNIANANLEKLKVLFYLYERLKYSSLSPQGHEEDVVIVLDGNAYIFDQGNLELLHKTERKIAGPPMTAEEKTIEDIKKEEEKYKDDGLEHLALEEEIGKKKQIEDLMIMAKKYKDDSLEKKALLEEIEKIKRR
jgi:hypothetical protein